MCIIFPSSAPLQLWMKTLTQQGAVVELQSWLQFESQLKDNCMRIHQKSSTKAELLELLKFCKVETDLW